MTPWSYSSLTAFEQCPYRYQKTRVTKEVADPRGEAATFGSAVHKVIEDGIRTDAPLPADYQKYAPVVKLARGAPGNHYVEMKFGVDVGLTPVEFFGKNVWARGVLDFAAISGKTAVIVDWKTGKVKSDRDQLSLFAAAAAVLFPDVQTIRTGYAWLAYDRVDATTYTRAEALGAWDGFRKRAATVELALASNNYPKRPSGLCRKYCPVPSSMCEFSGRA